MERAKSTAFQEPLGRSKPGLFRRRHILEGSVQRDQNRVRVNAQLIDGESGAHLWADRARSK
jgi:hypothetical protein